VKEMKKKLILGIFGVGIVFCSLFIKTQSIAVSFNIEDQSTESSNLSLSPASSRIADLSLVPHESIHISNDGNFSDYGFDGTGDESTPYIIEDYNITIANGHAIRITGTTKYFIVRDCFLEGGGIIISSVSDGTALLENVLIVLTMVYHY
jgi:hypothetical protein